MQLTASSLLDHSALAGTYAMDTVKWAQMEAGQFEVRYGVIEAGSLELSLRRFNVGFKAQAQIAPRKILFGLGGERGTKARWFGTPIGPQSIAISQTLLDVQTHGPAAFYQVTVDLDALERLHSESPDAAAVAEGIAKQRALTADSVYTNRLRRSLREAFKLGSGPQPAVSRGVPRGAFDGTIIPLLAGALRECNARPGGLPKSQARRLIAVHICETYMHDRIGSAVTLLDLSEAARMPARSLINAFEAVTGFSPMVYLKRLRLNGVRRALQRADRRTTRIIDLAFDWGFWHMGHFAADYRAMFGETPSQTLLEG